ncbi:thioesterase family protein [Haliangium sp.]|uniref:thioesterase family protein n=1 Tax=Haliangium sp. TaxID=2663208 RepID=UPI003D0E553D
MSDAPNLAWIKSVMEQRIPFNRLLGIELVHIAPRVARLRVPFRDDLIGDPFRPALHGGLIATLLDTCGGAAVFTMLDDPKDRTSTVDLRVDYLRPGRPSALVAEAHVIRAGNRVAVIDAVAFHEGERDQPVATGKGVYNLRRFRDES